MKNIKSFLVAFALLIILTSNSWGSDLSVSMIGRDQIYSQTFSNVVNMRLRMRLRIKTPQDESIVFPCYHNKVIWDELFGNNPYGIQVLRDGKPLPQAIQMEIDYQQYPANDCEIPAGGTSDMVLSLTVYNRYIDKVTLLPYGLYEFKITHFPYLSIDGYGNVSENRWKPLEQWEKFDLIYFGHVWRKEGDPIPSPIINVIKFHSSNPTYCEIGGYGTLFGLKYLLQGSTNQTQWTNIKEFVSDGTFNLHHTNDLNLNYQFFRVRVVP